MAFCSSESEKRRFHFPHESMSCFASHRFGHPCSGAMVIRKSLIRAPMLGCDSKMQVIDLGALDGRIDLHIYRELI